MTRPTILLLGKNGQAGWALASRLALIGKLITWGRHEADLSRPDTLEALLDTVSPTIIVNAAAYTAVDRAESEPALAHTINAEAPAVIARWASQHGAWFIHYSTDYVFDGTKSEPYREDDPTAPLNVYGHSKLAGEEAILASGAPAIILRTSWVYGLHGHNFLKTMLRLAHERTELRVVNDQIGVPTGTQLIADVTSWIVRRLIDEGEKTLAGIYHLAPQGQTNWYDYARLVFDVAHRYGAPLALPEDGLQPIPTSAYPTPAQRPLHSLLATEKLMHTFDISLPPWQDEVERTTEILVNGWHR